MVTAARLVTTMMAGIRRVWRLQRRRQIRPRWRSCSSGRARVVVERQWHARARARAPPHPYQTRRNDVATPRTACEPCRCRSGCAIVARAGRVGGGVVGDDHARARTRSSGSDSGVPFSRPLPTGRRCRHLTSVGPPPPPPALHRAPPSLSNYKHLLTTNRRHDDRATAVAAARCGTAGASPRHAPRKPKVRHFCCSDGACVHSCE